MKPSLKFIALSGTTDVTENLYVYEYLPDGRQVIPRFWPKATNN